MKCCNHFHIEEFVPKDTFLRLGKNSLLLMDNRIIAIADQLRNYFGKPITINNWVYGSDFTQRGWREHGINGKNYSMHCFGRAIDFDVAGLPAAEVRKAISMHEEQFPLIRGMELDTNWVHVDCGYRHGIGIVTFTA